MSKTLAMIVCGIALAGCTASGDLMKTATPTVPLQFESDPPGAEVKTSGGQTCRTPCALAVPAADLQATYALNGFQSQTVAIKLMPPDEIRADEFAAASNAPRFDPSPVSVELARAGPTKRAPKKQPRVVRQPGAEPQPRVARQPEQRPADSGFAPPPPATSGFSPPPPPSNGGFGQPAQRSAPATSAWPAPGTQVR